MERRRDGEERKERRKEGRKERRERSQGRADVTWRLTALFWRKILPMSLAMSLLEMST